MWLENSRLLLEGETTIFVAVEELDQSVGLALSGAEVAVVPEEVEEFVRRNVSVLVTVHTLEGGVGCEVSDGAKTLTGALEAAFSVAVQQDAELFSQAFDQNIILVGPSTLLATLRTIHNIWRHEQQNRNAIEIASAAGALYDKFVAFVGDLEEIGQRIDATRKTYDKAHNKLSSGKGNLIARVENMKKLGARTSKRHAAQLLAKAGDGGLEALERASAKGEE